MKRKAVLIAVVLLLAAGTAPLFSQQLIATYDAGWDFSDLGGFRTGATVLLTGKSGITVSLGASITPFMDVISNRDGPFGLSGIQRLIPFAGVGYVYYSGIYLGALWTVTSSAYGYSARLNNTTYSNDHDAIVFAPTLVAGIDLGGFVLGAQASYRWNTGYENGFTISLGLGVNLGAGLSAE